MLLDFISFIIAMGVLVFIFPYAQQTVVKIVGEYRMRGRIKRAQEGQGATEEEISDDGSIGLSKSAGSDLGKIGAYLAETNQGLIEEMQELLTKAGLRHPTAMQEFVRSKINAAIALFFITMLLIGTNDFGVPVEFLMPLSLVVGVGGGHILTNMNMEAKAQERKSQIEHGVPDFVDLLVICTESGLDLNRAIQRIAREMRTSNPVLAEELSLTAIELEMIPDTRQVFENFEKRTDCLEIKAIASTLIQASEYGSSLSTSLKDLATETRQKRMLDAEAAAARAPTMLTLPMMVFIMPCLFIIMLGPVIVGMIQTFNK